jgi:hypothetical protein
MSLSVYLNGEPTSKICACPACGDTHLTEKWEDLYSDNITHNLVPMAIAAGIYKELWRPAEIGVYKAKQLIEPLNNGLKLLKSDPERFQRMNPSNGWGDYKGLVRFVENYLDACREDPEAHVSVSR